MIWYACYGSNLLEERFACYIHGGTPAGAQRTYPGCTDKSFPREHKTIEIPAELYFARSSKTWNGGGAAFLKPKTNPNEKNITLGRSYLITKAQFIELVKQEIRHEGFMNIDFEQVMAKGSLVVKKKCWYGKILFLGIEDDYPVLTFTNQDFLKNEINPPDRHYLQKIIKGLKEVYQLNEIEIQTYLESKKGIKDFISPSRLQEIIRNSQIHS